MVKKIRGEITFGRLKVGHAGTLDPLATGLLIICTGKKTRQISLFQDAEKEYTGKIRLGAVTASYDLETEPENFREYGHLKEEDILNTLAKFTGKINQTPPAFSAKKIQGERAYEMAREGRPVVLNPVDVYVHSFEITRFDLPDLEFKVVCSKGTYIRSLAHDLGRELGCGAHLASLCRTRIGTSRLENAWPLADLLEELAIYKEKHKPNKLLSDS